MNVNFLPLCVLLWKQCHVHPLLFWPGLNTGSLLALLQKNDSWKGGEEKKKIKSIMELHNLTVTSKEKEKQR